MNTNESTTTILPTMTCPVCQHPMDVRKVDTSYTKDQTTFYDRQFLVCRTDDVWMRVETPQQHGSQALPSSHH